MANVPDNQPEVPVEPTPAATAPAPAPQPDNWEHKYRSLQGRYNSDVPQLQKQVKTLEAQLQDAIARLNEVAKPAAPADSKPTVDPHDVENFGEDLVGMVQRVAERMFGGVAKDMQTQAAQLSERMARLEEALKGTSQSVAVTQEQAFFDRLAKLVPEWESVNVNDAFLAWLLEVDPVYGEPRQTALEAAQRRLDAERAANVFKAFMATQTPPTKPTTVQKQVSPKGAASPAPTATDSRQFITEKQISDFYNDLSKGLYRGRPEEVARIEAQINAAIAEGRVR